MPDDGIPTNIGKASIGLNTVMQFGVDPEFLDRAESIIEKYPGVFPVDFVSIIRHARIVVSAGIQFWENRKQAELYSLAIRTLIEYDEVETNKSKHRIGWRGER
jgi:hypothetical protein